MQNSLQKEIWKDMIMAKYGFRPLQISQCTFIWIMKGKRKEDNLWTPRKSF